MSLKKYKRRVSDAESPEMKYRAVVQIFWRHGNMYWEQSVADLEEVTRTIRCSMGEGDNLRITGCLKKSRTSEQSENFDGDSVAELLS